MARTKNGRIERERAAAGGDLIFLHRLEKGGLGFGRRAVDFVGEDDVCEDGAFDEAEPSAPPVAILFQNVRAGDVGGHQVGRELDAVKFKLKDPGEGADHQRLGQAGYADQQAMPARHEGGEQQLDHVILADDDLVQFG